MLSQPEPEIERMMRRYEEATAATRRDLVTMDLLGGTGAGAGAGADAGAGAGADAGAGAGAGGRRRIISSNSNNKLRLHHLLNLRFGWERHLHLPSGEASDDDHRSSRTWTTLSRVRSSPSSSPSGTPPPPRPLPPSLDLKLFTPGMECRSVCTLDKVKLALDRIKDPRQMQSIRSSSSSSSTTASSTRRKRRRRMMRDGEDEQERQGTDSESFRSEKDDLPGLQAAGCPSCLSYVLIARGGGNPTCHLCNSPVHVPLVQKKHKIDLNSH